MTAADLEQALKAAHSQIRSLFSESEKADNPTILTLFSLNSQGSGQWVIGDPSQDGMLVAQRLRLAADIIEGKAKAGAK